MGDLSENFIIKEIRDITNPIYDLLLLADPSRKVVDGYIAKGMIFVVSHYDNIVGEYVLIHTCPETIEIVNIAIKEDYQGKGLGKFLLKDAIKRASTLGARVLEIGTANSSVHQMILYQKIGFRITGVDKDFFVRNYDDPIYENGIQCLDMVRLSMYLNK